METRPKLDAELDGAHRGGSAYGQRLTTKVRELPPEPKLRLELRVVDPEPGRAERLAENLNQQGLIKALPETRRVADRSNTKLQILALDDAQITARLVNSPPQNPSQVLLPSILVSAPDFGRAGGPVLGFGGVVEQSDIPACTEAKRLFSRIAQIAGPRTTSHAMSSALINSAQMQSVRQIVHNLLAEATISWLRQNDYPRGLFVAEGLSRAAYTLFTFEEAFAGRRRELMQAALRDIAPTISQERLAIGFLSESDTDLMLILVSRSNSFYKRRRVIYLPGPDQHRPPAGNPFSVFSRTAEMLTDIRPSHRSSRQNGSWVTATD